MTKFYSEQVDLKIENIVSIETAKKLKSNDFPSPKQFEPGRIWQTENGEVIGGSTYAYIDNIPYPFCSSLGRQAEGEENQVLFDDNDIPATLNISLQSESLDLNFNEVTLNNNELGWLLRENKGRPVTKKTMDFDGATFLPHFDDILGQMPGWAVIEIEECMYRCYKVDDTTQKIEGFTRPDVCAAAWLAEKEKTKNALKNM